MIASVPSLKIPPPSLLAVLPESVEFVTVSVAVLL